MIRQLKGVGGSIRRQFAHVWCRVLPYKIGAFVIPPDLMLFFKGIAIGVAVAAPVGPVAVLCIRRTLQHGRAAGFASGIGAVVADLIFGTIACLGVVAISDLLLTWEAWLRGFGGVVMIALGIIAWFQKDKPGTAGENTRLLSSFASAFVVTITNPITIFAFTAIFAGFGVVSDEMTHDATVSLLLGVTLGCVLWWGGLTVGSAQLRGRIGSNGFVWLHHLSGGLLVLFGIASVGSLLFV